MTNEDKCPIHGDNHKYFIFKVVEYFEPAVVEERFNVTPNIIYYVKNEYALLGCNCGSVVREKVKKGIS